MEIEVERNEDNVEELGFPQVPSVLGQDDGWRHGDGDLWIELNQRLRGTEQMWAVAVAAVIDTVRVCKDLVRPPYLRKCLQGEPRMLVTDRFRFRCARALNIMQTKVL